MLRFCLQTPGIPVHKQLYPLTGRPQSRQSDDTVANVVSEVSAVLYVIFPCGVFLQNVLVNVTVGRKRCAGCVGKQMPAGGTERKIVSNESHVCY